MVNIDVGKKLLDYLIILDEFIFPVQVLDGVVRIVYKPMYS